MKNILITGTTGFIGIRLLLWLKRQASKLKVKGETRMNVGTELAQLI